jgi:hypothetical protein
MSDTNIVNRQQITIYMFYTPVRDSVDASIVFPDWHLIASGPINTNSFGSVFTHCDVYTGVGQSETQMKTNLINKFNQLCTDGFLETYRMSNQYTP